MSPTQAGKEGYAKRIASRTSTRGSGASAKGRLSCSSLTLNPLAVESIDTGSDNQHHTDSLKHGWHISENHEGKNQHRGQPTVLVRRNHRRVSDTVRTVQQKEASGSDSGYQYKVKVEGAAIKLPRA